MSHNENCKQLRNKHKCSYCKKSFMMDWAYQNHVKNCVWKEEK